LQWLRSCGLRFATHKTRLRPIKLNGEILRIIALPDIRERFAAVGFEPIGTTPGAFAAYIRAEVPRWAKIVRDADIKVE